MTAALFTRDGSPFTGSNAVQNDKGAWFFTQPHRCGRCGGAGGSEAWRYTGWTCYECSGKGTTGIDRIPLYDADKLAKLNATKAKADARKAAKLAAKQAAEKAEADARRDAFLAEHGDLLAWARAAAFDADGCVVQDFLASVVWTADRFAHWSDAQAAAIAKFKASREAMDAKRAASRHVGAVGKRFEGLVTVERVSSYERPVFNAPWVKETVFNTTLRTEDGNVLVVKFSHFHQEVGAQIVIRATIKEHAEYKGEAQTIIKRVIVPAEIKMKKEENERWLAQRAAEERTWCAQHAAAAQEAAF